MPRIARVVVPEIPHHITQRGNRRQKTFFLENDYKVYLELMKEWCGRFKVEIWGYCLMPNHVHMIAVPPAEDSLSRAIGEAHRRYSRMINFREGWRGHLWQSRFGSFPMDDSHTLCSAKYIDMNPVRAKMVDTPGDYKWSSAAAHIEGKDDGFLKFNRLDEMVDSWAGFLMTRESEYDNSLIRKHERTGRPLGDENFIIDLQEKLGKELLLKKPGPKKGRGGRPKLV